MTRSPSRATQERSILGAADRIYRRTSAGLWAWQNQSPNVPAEMRNILAVVDDETHPDTIRARLRRYSDAQIKGWLAKLEELRMLESAPMAADHDLDFTGNDLVSDLPGEQAA